MYTRMRELSGEALMRRHISLLRAGTGLPAQPGEQVALVHRLHEVYIQTVLIPGRGSTR